MKYAGVVLCLVVIFGAVSVVGVQLFNDIMSALFVLGGAFGYALLRNEPSQMSRNFGEGAVHFGWLGTLIGLIAIAGNAFGAWGNLNKMGPALAVSMLPLLYGYIAKLVSMVFAAEPAASSDD